MITNKSQAIKFVLLLSFLYCFNYNSYSQVSPLTDNNWVINSSKSDEFNAFSLDLTKWDALDPPNGIGHNWGGGGLFRPSNVSVDGSNLQLKVEEISPTYPRQWSGGVRSKTTNYSYGYFEMRAKLPGFYDNGQPIGDRFFPAFWTYFADYNQWPCYHDEIDILESTGIDYADGKSYTVGHWDHTPESWDPNANILDCPAIKYNEYTYTNMTPIFDNFHKYAVEWLPDRINYYFDDILISSNYNVLGMPTHEQYVVMDQQMDGNIPLHPNTPLPLYMTVDYFRYYELNKDCNTDALILNNTQLNSFVFQVKRNITIGNGTTSIYFPPNTKKTLRFSNELTINGSFTVFLGSELNLIPTPCN